MRVRLFIATFFVMTMCTPVAYACKCMSPDLQHGRQAYANAEIVVHARVVLVSKGWNNSGPLATLRVERVYKGDVETEENLVIQYNSSTSACGLILSEGQDYTLGLYSMASKNDGRARIGEYRAMNSCEQSNIEFYLNEKEAK